MLHDNPEGVGLVCIDKDTCKAEKPRSLCALYTSIDRFQN